MRDNSEILKTSSEHGGCWRAMARAARGIGRGARTFRVSAEGRATVLPNSITYTTIFRVVEIWVFTFGLECMLDHKRCFGRFSKTPQFVNAPRAADKWWIYSQHRLVFCFTISRDCPSFSHYYMDNHIIYSLLIFSRLGTLSANWINLPFFSLANGLN